MNKGEVIHQLAFLVGRTNGLYSAYKKDPVYRRARLILDTNSRIIDLLSERAFLFDENEQTAINGVLDHFLYWKLQFEEAEKQILSPEDAFAFARCPQAAPYPVAPLRLLLEQGTS